MTRTSQSIANGFSRAARQYDVWARSQYRAAERLIAMLPASPGRVVDLGCGTGAVIDLLLKQPPGKLPSHVEGVDISSKMIEAAAARFGVNHKLRFHQSEMTAFLEHPPCDEIGNCGGYDTILSNFAAQWAERPERLCVVSRLNLKLKGQFALCVPVEGSLPELHDAIAQTGRTLHSVFRSAEEWRRIVSNSGFKITAWEEDDLMESYPSGRDALASVHRIGAARALHAGRSRLTVAQMRRVIRSLEAAGRTPPCENENAASERGVTMTYRAIWCVATNQL